MQQSEGKRQLQTKELGCLWIAAGLFLTQTPIHPRMASAAVLHLGQGAQAQSLLPGLQVKFSAYTLYENYPRLTAMDLGPGTQNCLH